MTSSRHIAGLWCIHIVVASLYLAAALIVDGNMSLLNIGRKISLIHYCCFDSRGPIDAVVLLLVDKKRRWISITLLLMYILLIVPALL